jgi:hypothetical protein
MSVVMATQTRQYAHTACIENNIQIDTIILSSGAEHHNYIWNDDVVALYMELNIIPFIYLQ